MSLQISINGILNANKEAGKAFSFQAEKEAASKKRVSAAKKSSKANQDKEARLALILQILDAGNFSSTEIQSKLAAMNSFIIRQSVNSDLVHLMATGKITRIKRKFWVYIKRGS